MKLFCSRCEAELTFTTRVDSEDFDVAPCNDCLQEEFDHGYDKGQEDYPENRG